MREGNKRIIFRRVRGRIIPIAASGAVGVGLGVGGSIALRKTKQELPSAKKANAYLALGMVGQVASGVISGLPSTGKKMLAGFAASVGIDAASSAAFMKAASLKGGTRQEKLKRFAKYQAVGSGIGWGLYGSSLLANKSVRTKLLSLGRRLITRGK